MSTASSRLEVLNWCVGLVLSLHRELTYLERPYSDEHGSGLKMGHLACFSCSASELLNGKGNIWSADFFSTFFFFLDYFFQRRGYLSIHPAQNNVAFGEKNNIN